MKKYRWIHISLILWGLIWAGALGMRRLSMQTHEELAATPMPIKPELEEVQPKNPGSKVELYRDELKADKNEQFLPKESERSKRVEMAWREVYKKEKEDKSEGDDERLSETEDKERELRGHRRNNATRSAPLESIFKSRETGIDTAEVKNGTPSQTGFHTAVIASDKANTEAKVIKAIIYGEQEIRSGEAVKLRTQEPLLIGGERLPAGTTLIGTSQKGKRLFIEIKQMSFGGKLRQVSISCLDASDMQPGLIIQKPTMEDKMREELANAATDETLSQIPVGGGILRSGKRLIEEALSGKNKGRVILPHGYEIIITLNSSKN